VSRVEALRRLFERMNAGDIGDIGDCLHPDAELHQPPELPDTDSYYGRDEVIRGTRLWLEGWEGFSFEPEEITEAGEYVLVRIRLSGRGKGSGIDSTTRLHHAWTFRDGLPCRCVIRGTPEAALADAKRLD
jgi:ketosteroid isomerase-like protein